MGRGGEGRKKREKHLSPFELSQCGRGGEGEARREKVLAKREGEGEGRGRAVQRPI